MDWNDVFEPMKHSSSTAFYQFIPCSFIFWQLFSSFEQLQPALVTSLLSSVKGTMEVLSSMITEIGKCLWPPLKTRVAYLACYGKKVEELRERLDKLQPLRNDIVRQLDEARRKDEVIKDVVNAWLTRVTEWESNTSRIEDKFKQNKRCCKGCCPDWSWRYRLGKEAAENTVKAENLLQQGKSFGSVSQPPPQPIFESMPAGDFMAFTSTREAMKKVFDALEDEKKHLIGIYGMGGVGKTTLMEEIGRRARRENMFDTVVKVVVSQTPDPVQIQRDIAESLGTTLRGHGDSAAAALASRLKKEKKILIMLDDVWARLELKKVVGIPFGEDHSGCKILITTRKAQVCGTMECDTAVLVDVLSDEDSWVLFKSKAGEVIENPDLKPLSSKVVKECARLPLAIVVVGRALRGHDKKGMWEGALLQLKQSIPKNLEGVEDQLFKCLELSYNYMKDEETKLLFLFCCLFREDYNITEDELARYAVGEGFLKDVYELKDARAKVHLLVEDLIASCLLLNTDKERVVKMHDVVRDVAVYIASKGENRFFVKAGLGMKDWPEEENLGECRRISLMNNDISILPDRPNCPKVHTLLLNVNPSLHSMPSDFFKGMVSLTVLDLSDSNIESLPSSLSCLTKLGTLRLDRCEKLRDISRIGHLHKLKILGLQKCPINVLPEEISTLVDLRLFDLSYCTSLRIPPNMIRKLCRLEELYLKSCMINKALLVEIASLERLVCLQVYVRDVKYFSQEVIPPGGLKNLNQFIIYTEVDWFVLANVYQRNFYLKGVNNIANWAKELLRKAEDLIFEGCKWEFTSLALLDKSNGFISLKKLRLTRCHHLECLLDTEEEASLIAFVNLEVLNLWNLDNLNRICKGPLPALSFGKLKMLDIMRCNKLVDIMPSYFMRRVHSCLHVVAVKECENPHVLFNFEGLQNESVVLPNLRTLTLHRLRNLKSIWSGAVLPGSLQNLNSVEVIGCDNLASIFSQRLGLSHSKFLPPQAFRNLREIKIWSCRSLRYLFSASLANELQSLERLELKNNDNMEAIIAEEDGVILKKDAFPLLKDLLLINLLMVKSFYQGEPAEIFIDFPSLKYVKLGSCPNLRRLPFGQESAPRLRRVHVAGDEDVKWFQSLEWKDASIPLRFDIQESSIEHDQD